MGPCFGSWVADDAPSFSYAATSDTSGAVFVEARSIFAHKGFLGVEYARPERWSVARISENFMGCMLALDPPATAAISIGGSSDVNLKNCVMVANSTANGAISRTGDAALQAQCAVTSGTTSGFTLKTKLDCGQALEKRAPVPDPLKEVELPSYTACRTVPAGSTKTLSPGTYCNQTFSGSINLEPGTYVLRGGKISLGGSNSLTGAGVTLLLCENASMTVDGNQTVGLSAPTTGPYKGIVIFQDRDNSQPLTLTGSSGSTLVGFIYAPAAHVLFTGSSSSSSSGCTRLVSNTIATTGASKFRADCTKELAGVNIRASTPMLVR